jgi:hypothetical protein
MKLSRKFLALLAALLAVPLVAYASVTVTVNGSNHTIPQTNEKGWGANVTAWIQAISANTLQPSGGTFTLTADTDFGASFGLKSTYFKSRSSSIAGAGILRLANTDTIGFRNAADSGNLLLGVDTSNRLTFNGVVLPTPGTASFDDSGFRIYDNADSTKKLAFEVSAIGTSSTRTITMPDSNVDLTDLTTATSSNTVSKIVKRDGSGNFSAGTITAALTGNVTGNLTGNSTGTHTGAVVGNADTATALAANPSDCAADTYATTIAASGNLTCATVTNAGLAGSIAASKLVGSDIATVGTITSGTWSATTIAVNKGGTGQTTANAAFGALSPQTTKGDQIAYNGTTAVRFATGTDGQFLKADTTTASGWVWADVGASTAIRDTNLLINGEFRLFQFTTPGSLSTITDGGYAADQWYMIDSNGGSASQIARADASGTSVGGQYTQYWANFRQGNAVAKQIGVCQPLEASRSVPLRGKQVTFAVYAKTDTTEITTLRTCIGEWTGTADTITRDVVGTWGATPTWIANYACANTPADQTISSSWTQLSTTVTLGTSVNNLIVCVWTPNAEAQNDDFYLSQAQLVEGSTAPAWKVVQKTFDEDLLEVRRYFQKSFAYDTPSAQNAGTTNAVYIRQNTSSNVSYGISLSPRMRTTPSVTNFNPSASNSSARDVDNSADRAFVDTNYKDYELHWAFNSGAVGIVRWHWQADARL